MSFVRSVVSDFVLQVSDLAATYTGYKSGAIAQTCTVTVTFNADGTWDYTHNGSSGTGSPTSGNWGLPTTPGAGTTHEINVVDNGGSGTAAGATGAGVWVALTSGRAVSNSVTDNTSGNGSLVASRSFTVTIRKIGTTTPTFTDTFSLNPEAEDL